MGSTNIITLLKKKLFYFERFHVFLNKNMEYSKMFSLFSLSDFFFFFLWNYYFVSWNFDVFSKIIEFMSKLSRYPQKIHTRCYILILIWHLLIQKRIMTLLRQKSLQVACCTNSFFRWPTFLGCTTFGGGWGGGDPTMNLDQQHVSWWRKLESLTSVGRFSLFLGRTGRSPVLSWCYENLIGSHICICIYELMRTGKVIKNTNLKLIRFFLDRAILIYTTPTNFHNLIIKKNSN
jgi:hypothetical protein